MKTIAFINSLIATLLLMFSCTDDYEGLSQEKKGTGELREVRFLLKNALQLKSMNEDERDWEFIPGDRIGIFAVDMNNWAGGSIPGDLYANNNCFEYDGRQFNPMREEDRIFVCDENPAFYAYYPYNSTRNNNGPKIIFSVCPFQNIGRWDRPDHEGHEIHHASNDLLVAANEEGLMVDVIPLSFRHMMAKVEIEFNHGTDRIVDSIVLSQKYLNCYVDMMHLGSTDIADTLQQDVSMRLVSRHEGVSNYRALIPEQEVEPDSLLLRIYAGGKEYLHYVDDYFTFKLGFTHRFSFSLPCTINLATTPGGTVSGEGTYRCGDNVMVMANMDRGYNFSGWYEDEKKVSDYQYYSFIANGDRTLEAHFYPF